MFFSTLYVFGSRLNDWQACLHKSCSIFWMAVCSLSVSMGLMVLLFAAFVCFAFVWLSFFLSLFLRRAFSLFLCFCCLGLLLCFWCGLRCCFCADSRRLSNTKANIGNEDLILRRSLEFICFGVGGGAVRGEARYNLKLPLGC